MMDTAIDGERGGAINGERDGAIDGERDGEVHTEHDASVFPAAKLYLTQECYDARLVCEAYPVTDYEVVYTICNGREQIYLISPL